MVSSKEYLVILAGSPRGGEKTWKSLYNYVLEPLNADLAICCSDYWDQDSSLFEIAKFKWIYKKYENYEQYYEEMFDGNWKEFFLTGKDTGLYSSGLRHFVCKDMVKRNYLSILNEYKYIIYSRFDQYYVDIHPKIENDEILIPEGEDYKGICDRHAIFPVKYAEEFLSICDYINKPQALERVPNYNNCESAFLSQLTYNGLIKKVKRYNRSQFTATLKGEPTNWRVAKYKVYFSKKLMIKYPDEFIDSIKNSIYKNTFFKYFFSEPVLVLNYLFLMLRRMFGKLKSKYNTNSLI